jgi:non-ribosomal peptide synthetase component F
VVINLLSAYFWGFVKPTQGFQVLTAASMMFRIVFWDVLNILLRESVTVLVKKLTTSW